MELSNDIDKRQYFRYTFPWMKQMHKHRGISEYLRAGIAAGNFSPGRRLPSELQLVQKFKVSRPTVARAMRDLQGEGIIERRTGSGTYILDSGSGRASSSRLLGLLIPDLGNAEILEAICGELANLARVSEYSLLWGGATKETSNTDPSFEHAEELCRQFIDREVAGVFFAPYELRPAHAEVNRHLAETLRKAGVSVVLLDRDLESFPMRSNFDLVNTDNTIGGYLLADHLVKLGSRHFRFVTQSLSAPTIDARMAGVREALARHSIETEPGWVCLGDPSDMEFVRSLNPGRCAATFICANDFTAASLIRSFECAGIRVPQQVRVAGFDNVPYATLVSVPLTTIHQPCREIAKAAFRAMLDRITDPTVPARLINLTPKLVVRESCGYFHSRRRATHYKDDIC